MELRLNEKVKASKHVPWDYDIYDMVVGNQEVGRIVFRYGSKEQLKYCGHVGYHVEEEYRGHGYAYQALGLLMKIIADLNYSSINVTCEKHNLASLKTIQKFKVIDYYLETDIADPEYFVADGLWIYEIEVKV